MIDFSEDRLEPIEPAPYHCKPGEADVFFITTEAKQVPCRVIDVLRIKSSCLGLWPIDAQPGQLYYRIDYGQGPELWSCRQVHKRGEKEKELRRFYVHCRNEAVARGMTKEEFDQRYVGRGLTLETLDTARRIAGITPEQMRGIIHSMFVVINLSDSPVVRDGYLTELARCYFMPEDLILAEWDQWQRENGGKNKYRMAGVTDPTVEE